MHCYAELIKLAKAELNNYHSPTCPCLVPVLSLSCPCLVSVLFTLEVAFCFCLSLPILDLILFLVLTLFSSMPKKYTTGVTIETMMIYKLMPRSFESIMGNAVATVCRIQFIKLNFIETRFLFLLLDTDIVFSPKSLLFCSSINLTIRKNSVYSWHGNLIFVRFVFSGY